MFLVDSRMNVTVQIIFGNDRTAVCRTECNLCHVEVLAETDFTGF